MFKSLFISTLLIAAVISCAPHISSSASPARVKPDAHAMYISDINPIIQAKCTPCHIPEKGGFKASFAGFDSAAKYINASVVRVQLKPEDPHFMPFRSKRPALTEQEINMFKTWQSALVSK